MVKALLHKVQYWVSRAKYWVRDVTLKAKNEDWFDICEGLNQQTPLSKLWAQVRVATVQDRAELDLLHFPIHKAKWRT